MLPYSFEQEARQIRNLPSLSIGKQRQRSIYSADGLAAHRRREAKPNKASRIYPD